MLVMNLSVLGCWFIICKSYYFFNTYYLANNSTQNTANECKEIMNSNVIMSVSIYKMHKLIICWSSLTCISCQAMLVGSHL